MQQFDMAGAVDRLDTRVIHRLLKYLILVLALLTIILPLLVMISTGLKTQRAAGDYPPSLIPENPTLQPILTELQSGLWLQWFINTFVIAIFTVILTLAICVPAAYGLARRDFLGKHAVKTVIAALLMIPTQILLLPLFIQFVRLNLENGMIALIIAYGVLYSAFVTFVLMGFFRSLPSDVEEAARVAGISEWKIFTRIILPLAKPAIGVAATLLFVLAWNEFLYALIFLDSREIYSISIGLQKFRGIHGIVVFNKLMGMSVLASLPVLILFGLTQKRFIQGITTGYEF